MIDLINMDHNSEVESNLSIDLVFPINGSEGVSLKERATLQLLRQGIAETTEENSAFTKEISKLLQELGINCRTLPNDIREGLHKISLLLKSEYLQDIDSMEQRICQGEKLIQENKRQRNEKILALKRDTIYKKCSSLQRKAEELERAVNSLASFVKSAKVNEDTMYSNTILLSKKLKDYQDTLEKLESQLEKMDTSDLYPEIIEAKYKQYLESLGELAEVNRSIAKYNDLPPNLLQAKALLQTKEREYNEISQTFLEKTGNNV